MLVRTALRFAVQKKTTPFLSCVGKKRGGAWRQNGRAPFRRRASAPSAYPLPRSSFPTANRCAGFAVGDGDFVFPLWNPPAPSLVGIEFPTIAVTAHPCNLRSHYLARTQAVRTLRWKLLHFGCDAPPMPPLCKGRWHGEAVTEGLIPCPAPKCKMCCVASSDSNPSVSLTADSSLYTREPLRRPQAAFLAAQPSNAVATR